ncbi:4,5-DOPA dioxygenase extradiol [Taibaiella sp. KBW10]|uniref:4,5-DOPA-extradiol-dioxygenase n=1 Tax=Taibaiella sp. KBW10 TaxID=2153357 RepID=UPI000F59AD81|nr:4,5-DOPA dioxygenase extradiol [Taibaiella sp. KBW10]RQO31829.1 4,5-DOPA dioxygenase extradiol [Taibaiella sp. KBW10]
MDRKNFLRTMALLPIAGAATKLSSLQSMASSFSATEKMPVLFLGHGSPMNAIEENEFVSGFRKVATTIPKPKAIICISAHWETKGTMVTAMEMPKTIHDFGGFPKALFEVQYPAKGSPELARMTKDLITATDVHLDDRWGLDHGAWSVIKHMYPNADIPVIQMSIDYTASPERHYEIAQQLAALRRKGVLIIGSGNMVHNLGAVDWQNFDKDNYAYDWAIEANTKMKSFIMEGNHDALVQFRKQGKAFDMAIPSPEHYLPLVYTVALQEKGEVPHLFNDKAVAGSLTMTSVKIA